MSLSLPVAVRRAMVAHARRDAPRECCGLLVGRGRTVISALPAANLERSAVRFLLDPRTHIDARRVLRRLEPPLEILGCYHSHPAGPAIPSASDLKDAAYPDWCYVIVGVRAGRAEIAAYRIRRGRASAVVLTR